LTGPTERVRIRRFVPSLPMKDVEIAETNVRKTRPNSRIEELKASIERFGLLHPIVVIQAGRKYKLIVGQRRFLAFQQLKRTRIPALVIAQIGPRGQSVASFAENIHRRDLPYEDTIRICAVLFNEYGGPRVERIRRISEELGIPLSTVSKYLSYILIPPEVRRLVEDEALTRDQAYRLTVAFFPNKGKIIKLAREVTRLTKDERDRALDYGKKKPQAPVDEILEEALKPPKTFDIVVSLEMETYQLLEKIAKKRGTDVENFVKEKIDELLPDLMEELK